MVLDLDHGFRDWDKGYCFRLGILGLVYSYAWWVVSQYHASRYNQWRTWHSASGGGGGKRGLGSEGTKPERAKRARGGGGGWVWEGNFPPPTVGSFFILMLAIVRFHAYLWYISLIWKVFIIRKRLFYSRNKYNINVSNYRGQDHDYTIHIIIQFI